MAGLDHDGEAPRAARDIEADPDEHTRGPVPAQRCGPGGRWRRQPDGSGRRQRRIGMIGK